LFPKCLNFAIVSKDLLALSKVSLL
jgi:hypothetical protein